MYYDIVIFFLHDFVYLNDRYFRDSYELGSFMYFCELFKYYIVSVTDSNGHIIYKGNFDLMLI